MGNSLIFPVPKCSYTSSSLQPFYLSISVVEEFYTSKLATPKTIKQEIPALYIKSSTKSKYLMIYFHGNSVDLGQMFSGLLDYYEHFQIDILAPEYPGYGIYTGRPGALGMLRDAQHIIDYATRKDGLDYTIENIILIGNSLGSGVAIQLAARYPLLKALVTISPFTSIRDVANNIAGSISKFIIPDIFKSYDMMSEVQVPTLFIHGIKDEVIPYSHTVKLHERCASSKKQLELRELMSHNRYHMEKDIFLPMQKFFTNILDMIDLPFLEMKTLDFDQVFSGEKNSKFRSYASSRLGPLGAENMIIISGRESLPVESLKISPFKSDENSKESLQEAIPILKRVESDLPPTSKTLLTSIL